MLIGQGIQIVLCFIKTTGSKHLKIEITFYRLLEIFQCPVNVCNTLSERKEITLNGLLTILYS